MPSVIETELQEAKSTEDGHVTGSGGKVHKDHKGEATELEVESNVITWNGLILRRGQKFITTIKRVDLLDNTGPAEWVVKLGDTDITDADTDDSKANPPMVVVGTMEDDVVFEVVDEFEIPESNPSYSASSLRSIRFKFTAENTAIQKTGRLWFTVPVGWTLPSLTDKAGKATVSIVHVVDDEETFVNKIPEKTGDGKKAGEEMMLTASGRTVTLTIGAKGMLGIDGSVIIRYGDSTDPKKFPVQISLARKVLWTSDGDGLAIRGHFRVSNDFRQRDAGTIWADVTNVVDGSGTAALSAVPPLSGQAVQGTQSLWPSPAQERWTVVLSALPYPKIGVPCRMIR